ncbi:MAG: hypothetical protein KatS3mg111_4066 [Pirellulaceae bacterium]|nr:MAG: hypothetical protein KatS3mg111_4066 [Pirellulaceae bacterium]
MHGIWLVILAIVLAFYVIGLLGLGWWFSQREHTAEDFLVAGRRLPCWLTTFSLIATWYGAGTLLTVADEVREVGWTAALMDPVGAGLCLALAGWWIAAPLWRMNLLTVGDFFKQRYHRSVEIAAALVLIPSYFGWIAAQFVALAALLNHFFSIPLSLGLLTVAIVGTGYTVLGGMWAVAATDAVQLGCVLAGVGMLGWLAVDMTTAADLLEGLQFVPAEGEDPARLTVILDALVIGALGNLCGQDLIQRILSARSPQDARRACQMATIAYLVFGLIPIFLGAVGAAHGMRDGSVVMSLAEHLMHPAALIVFVVAVGVRSAVHDRQCHPRARQRDGAESCSSVLASTME